MTDTRPQTAPPEEITFASIDRVIHDAVRAVAATDPNPLDPFRGLYITDEAALAMAAGNGHPDLDVRLRSAAEMLGLEPVDAAVLAVCAAPDLAIRYGRLYAYLHDDVSRRAPSPRLVTELLTRCGWKAGEVLERFGRERPLRASGALQLQAAEGATMADRPVKVADLLVSFLLGVDLHGAGHTGMRRVDPPTYDIGRDSTLGMLRRLLARGGDMPIVVSGPDAAPLLAIALGHPLIALDASAANDENAVAEATIQAALLRGTVCIEGMEALAPPARRSFVRGLGTVRQGRVFLCVPDTDVLVDDLPSMVAESRLPTLTERRSIWGALCQGLDPAEVEDVAAKFRLSSVQIAEAAAAAQAVGDDPELRAGSSALDYGARQASSNRLRELASRPVSHYRFEDLVLPDRQRSVLRSVSSYLRHRDRVVTDWGFDRTLGQGQGLKVLFAGESGTGKTMAAQVLGNELGLDLYRIDLATVVSKYIGETEKNLDRIFTAATGSNAILFFDEADALFGKRSEVRDAHDRYANIEVAYLLQKIEGYDGAVILATNLRQNLDQAFLRRLDYVVDFPFPEPADRLRIWRLVLPEQAPQSADIDLEFLATQFKLSGGNIRNASVAAAFLAADDGGEIGMRHLVQGVALEYGKLGRLTLESEFERFHAQLRDDVAPQAQAE